jgi:hypothetical protein
MNGVDFKIGHKHFLQHVSPISSRFQIVVPHSECAFANGIHLLSSLTLMKPLVQLHIFIFSSSSSGHEVRPINDLFLPHDFIRLVVSLMVVQVFAFR